MKENVVRADNTLAEGRTAMGSDQQFQDQVDRNAREQDASLEDLRQSDGDARARRAPARKDVMVGAFFLILGLLITGVTWSRANDGDGGRYVVTYGLIIFGLFQMGRGLFNLRR